MSVFDKSFLARHLPLKLRNWIYGQAITIFRIKDAVWLTLSLNFLQRTCLLQLCAQIVEKQSKLGNSNFFRVIELEAFAFKIL